ncbi:hypothetical protein AC1031_011045 [Aphanomyces cochlioides]|nr:hypothetical protein AC1031_011045 [Aphanomyces cochlioides]
MLTLVRRRGIRGTRFFDMPQSGTPVALTYKPVAPLSINLAGRPYKDDLYRLWFMLVGVCLHLVWKRHNLALHQSKPIPPPHVMFELSFVLWIATVRRWLRQRDPDDPERVSTTAALRVLLRQPLYASLLAKHPRSLELESTFDVH